MTPLSPSIQSRIATLRTDINEHNYRYYVLDAPIISDAEYDSCCVSYSSLRRRILS